MTECSDEEVIRAVRNGDGNRYRVLVSRYQNQVCAMIMRQVGDRALAEELAHETFVKAYFGLKNFRSGAAFSTWLIRIALNHTSSYFGSRRYRDFQRSETFAARHEQASDPQEPDESEEQLRLFRRALAALKPALRDTVVLCALEGRRYEEAADLLGIPIGTVRSRLNKARLLMKQYIQKFEQE